MDKPITILGIAGSLRKGSYNRAALRAASGLAPEGARIEIFDIAGIPPFNQDEEGQLPETVAALKAKIGAADAILFVTAEYNYSIPGVLKNAIDWASRPWGHNSWEGKPVALMGASVAINGTARAQYHLRQVFVYLNMHPVNRPEVMIGAANKLFDDQGNLTDENMRESIRKLITELVDWTRKLQRADPARNA